MGPFKSKQAKPNRQGMQGESGSKTTQQKEVVFEAVDTRPASLREARTIDTKKAKKLVKIANNALQEALDPTQHWSQEEKIEKFQEAIEKYLEAVSLGANNS